jgi:hypothetical protein
VKLGGFDVGRTLLGKGMTEHELTSLPGYVARYWNADIPVLAITETTQGLVWTLLVVFSAILPVMQIFE